MKRGTDGIEASSYARLVLFVAAIAAIIVVSIAHDFAWWSQVIISLAAALAFIHVLGDLVIRFPLIGRVGFAIVATPFVVIMVARAIYLGSRFANRSAKPSQ